MNHRPDVIIADSTLLAGLLVAENTKIPCLAIVADDLTSSSTLKWTHPHLYSHHDGRQLSKTISAATNGAASPTTIQQSLSSWWWQLRDQIGMTTAFMSYNGVRRRLNLQPRYQILDFWKAVVLWTSMTHHLTDPPSPENSQGNEITEKDSVLVDFRAYLYSKTGIGIGTSASKGNSLPLISLPEAAVPPCQPCEADEYDSEQDESWDPENEDDESGIRIRDNSQSNEPNHLQILLPYYSHGNTLEDRQRFRKLMRALVLLRDSLVAWPRCPQGEQESSDGPLCWIGSDPQWNDFQVIRLGALHEAFIPSIVRHVGTPFVDAIAEHRSLAAMILPNCHTSSSSNWMRDLNFPTLCLPEGDVADWNVRDIALQIGRLLRKMEGARKRNEKIPSFQMHHGNESSKIQDDKHKQNAHTLYGTTIENIANVVETMGQTRRQAQGVWETGDDMAWDVWLHLGLVRHPAAVLTGQESTGWFRGCLVTLSWAFLVVACVFMLVKDREWFTSFFNSSSRRRRNHNNSKVDESDALSSTDSIEDVELSLSEAPPSLLSFFFDFYSWPSYIQKCLELIHSLSEMIVDEFTEQLPELDRLVDMWKEWAEEESEQLDLLLFSYFDEQPQSEGEAQANANGRQQRHANIENRVLQNDAQANHTNGTKHSSKRRSARKKH